MERAHPHLGPRIAAGLGAILAAAFLGVWLPTMILRGHPGTAVYQAIAGFVLAAFLGGVALAPGATQRVLDTFSRVRLADHGHFAATMVLAVALYYVFGMLLSGGIYAIEDAARVGIHQELQRLDGTELLQSVVTTLAVLTIPVFLFLSFVGETGPSGAMRALGLDLDGAGRQIAAGLLVALGFLVTLVAMTALLVQLGVGSPPNPRALEIARSLTWASALAVALCAAVGEEVFFRGFLLPRVGLWMQAILFALLHLSYVNVLEIAVTLSLALVLGLMRRRTGSLWGPIAAHFAFDFVQLVAGSYLPG